MKKMWSVAAIGAAFVLGFVARGVVPGESVVNAQSKRVFELRTYTAPEGKLEELHARFRDHTMRIFKNHNMTNVAYFRPQDSPLKENTLIYVISHASREAAKENWAAFGMIPSGRRLPTSRRRTAQIQDRSPRSSRLFLDATDYSPMK